MHWSQWVSVASIILFLFLLGTVGLAFFIPMSRTKTRWVCGIGISIAILLGVQAALLYSWHHFIR